jgi:hypothetical protein
MWVLIKEVACENIALHSCIDRPETFLFIMIPNDSSEIGCMSRPVITLCGVLFEIDLRYTWRVGVATPRHAAVEERFQGSDHRPWHVRVVNIVQFAPLPGRDVGREFLG